TPTMIRMSVTNRPKLSAATTSKLDALWSQSTTAATAAPMKPTRPRPPIGIRSPGSRKASATIAATPAAVTHAIGTIALKDCIMSGIRRSGLGTRRDSGFGIRPVPHRPLPLAAGERALDRRLDRAQEKVREDAHHHSNTVHWHDGRPFARLRIRDP